VENLGETQKSSALGDRNESMTTTSCAHPKKGQETNTTEQEEVFEKPDKVL
jgi:hypothetical protein